MKEQPASLVRATPDAPDTRTQAHTEGILEDFTATIFAREAIIIPVRDFWRALCWALPVEEGKCKNSFRHKSSSDH
ncbi:MAG TPA: hypothetical protein VKY19_01185 [Ktedonosporobacter sp.]|nr:hypothetical protein [Ktedonosporobacter sp.]